MLSRNVAHVLACALIFTLGARMVAAQGLTQESGLGSINGTVTDTSTASVPDAKVTLQNIRTGAQRTTLTSNLGYYSIPALRPGTYRISVEKNGFSTQVRTDIPLQVQQSLAVNFVLAVGAVSDRVAVTGEAPVLEPTNTTIGQVVNQVQTEELPLNGRQFTQLTLLSPGAAPVGGWLLSFHSVKIGSGGISPSINGANGNFNNFTLDGVDNNNRFAAYWAISPPPDAIQEVRVQTGLYAGSNVNVATKAGTNEFHGSLWEFLRNDKLDARNTFDITKPPYRQNQYGFAAGGPIYVPKIMDGRKTGTWIFGYWEGYRSRRASTYFATVPTPQMLNADFSALLGPQVGTDAQSLPVFQRGLYNPFSTRDNPTRPGQLLRDPFPNNQIPKQMIHPLALEYIATFYPSPNQPVFPNNFILAQTTRVDSDQGGVRFDQRLGASDLLFVRANIQNASQLSPGVLPKNPNIKENRTDTFVGSYTRIFTPTLLLNAALGYTRDFTPYYNPGVSADFQARLGMKDLIPPYKYKGDIYLADQFGIGPTFNSVGQLGWFLGAPDYSYQANASMTHNKGNHTFNWGVIATKWRHIGEPQPSLPVGFSQLTTGNPAFAANTGEAFASMLLGLPNNGINFIIPKKNSDGWLWDLFAGDQWKITPRFTANIGLHWNYRLGPYNLHDQMSIFNIATGKWQWAAKNPITGEAPNLRPGLFDPDYKNFAPTLGLAYQMFGKTVVRTGFNVSYDHGITLVQGNQELLGNYPFGSRASTINQNVGVPSGATLTNPIPGVSVLTENTTPATTANPWNRVPYIMQWNFGFQQEVAPNMVLSTDYVGSRGRRLMMQLQYNMARYPAPGPLAPRQRFPQFGTFNLDTNEGKSNYDALQAKLERRFAQGLTFLASYTWSKTLGTVNSPVGGNVQDVYNINGSRGPLTYDVPQMFVFSSVYELPFGRGKPWSLPNPVARTLAGGWNISGILSLYYGTPLSVSVPFDNANTGSIFQRADVVGDVHAGGFGTRQQWFNTQAFAVPKQYTYGNSGMGILRGPGTENLDFSVFKRFDISESKRMELRFEGFNVLNHTNLGNPNTTFGSLNFGKIFGAAPVRDIQIGMKFGW